MEWLQVEDLIRINRREVGITREPYAVLAPGNLESGLNRPRNVHLYRGTTDIVLLGAELLYGLAKAHAFLQGNKRTAFYAMTVFLGLNSWDVLAEDEIGQEELEKQILSLITDEIDAAAFADYLRPFTRNLSETPP